MIKHIFSELFQTSLLISLFFMTFLYIVIISQWNKWLQKLKFIKSYQGIQRAHEGEIPRMGGLVTYIGLFICCSLYQNDQVMQFMQCILISSIPLMILSLKEDLFHNTKAITRLIFMGFSSVLFFLYYDISFPVIELPIFGDWLLNSEIFRVLFFTICVLVIINGSNLIDGVNGLLPITALMQCLCLFYITYEYNDSVNSIRLCYLVLPIIIFMLFNYPLGKIFLGDSGAYFIGFYVSMLTIIIFSDNQNIPTWYAALILIYPAFETLFSVIRKTIERKSPFDADQHHLHIKIFFIFKNKNLNSRISNSLVMPCLVMIWGFPFLILTLTNKSLILVLFSIVFFMIIYLGFFLAVSRKINDYDQLNQSIGSLNKDSNNEF